MNNNLDFLDILSIISFAISVANYNQNLQQSSNDDLMKEIDQKTKELLSKLESDISRQNADISDIKHMLTNLQERR
jgi:septal ring factor EnvC (AmiA/AmiB activator)